MTISDIRMDTQNFDTTHDILRYLSLVELRENRPYVASRIDGLKSNRSINKTEIGIENYPGNYDSLSICSDF